MYGFLYQDANGHLLVNADGTLKGGATEVPDSSCCCGGVECETCISGTATRFFGITVNGITETIDTTTCLCADLIEGVEFEVGVSETECYYGPATYEFPCEDGQYITIEINCRYVVDIFIVDIFVTAFVAGNSYAGNFRWQTAIFSTPKNCAESIEVPFVGASANFGPFCNVTTATVTARPYN